MTWWLVGRLWRGAGVLQWLLAVVLVATTALATAVVLALAAVPSSFEQQAQRLAWTTPPDWNLQADPVSDTSYVYTSLGVDTIGPRTVTVVQVAVVGGDIRPPAGVDTWPEPGEALVSPSVTAALQAEPAARGRYGDIVGTVGRDGLRGGGDLVVVRGVAPERMAAVAPPYVSLNEEASAVPNRTLALLLVLAGVALLVPPMLLAYTAAEGQREVNRRRTANLVVAGAPAALVRRIVAGEAGVASGLGALLGCIAFFLARPLLVRLLVVDPAPYPGDLRPSWPTLLLVLVGIPFLVTLLALWSSRKTSGDPLRARAATHQSSSPAALGVCGLLVLLAAVLWAWVGNPSGTSGLLAIMAAGSVGLGMLLPWLCRTTGRLLLSSSLPGPALGGAWLASAPWSGARAMLPPTLAMFVASTFVVANPTAIGSVPTPVVQQAAGTLSVSTNSLSGAQVEELTKELQGIDGVRHAASVLTGVIYAGQNPITVWLGDCQALAASYAMSDLDCGLPQSGWATAAVADALRTTRLEVTDLDPAEVGSMLDVAEGPSALPVPRDLAPVLTTSAQAVDRPQLVIDPARADLDTSSFRPTAILVRAAGTSVEEIRTTVLTFDPTATITTSLTSRAGYDAGLQRYYALLLWGGLGTFATASAALFAGSLTGIVRRSASIAVLGAVGTQVSTVRSAVVTSMGAPVVVSTFTALVLGIATSGSLLASTQGAALRGIAGLWPLLPALVLALAFGSLAALAVPAEPRLRDLPGE